MGFFFSSVDDMSSELTWQLIRKHNSFIRRRDGATFSAEPNNLTNKHAFKWSGLANKNAVGLEVNRDEDGNIKRGAFSPSSLRRATFADNLPRPGRRPPSLVISDVSLRLSEAKPRASTTAGI